MHADDSRGGRVVKVTTTADSLRGRNTQGPGSDPLLQRGRGLRRRGSLETEPTGATSTLTTSPPKTSATHAATDTRASGSGRDKTQSNDPATAQRDSNDIVPSTADQQQRRPSWVPYLTYGLLGFAAFAVLTGVVAIAAFNTSGSGIQLIGSGSQSEAESDTAVDVPSDCVVDQYLKTGSTGPSVACLEAHLAALSLFDEAPDENFDESTDQAVRTFQSEHDLDVDGVVGPLTGDSLDAWAGPDGAPPDDSTCPGDGRAAVVDRFNQRAWMCEDGSVTDVIPITSATDQPIPGTYEVYEKDLEASSNLTGRYSEMTHFVAFAKGIHSGARVAFHSVPTYDDGAYIQPLESVGTPEEFGDSSGCIRVLPDDAQQIWDWLDVGDLVIVVS